MKQAVRYDGNGLKTFEVLRKEYDATAVSEETLENNKKQLQQWKKYYEEESENRTAGASSKNREDVDLTQTLISGHDYDEDAYFVAGVVGIMAPPLWQEWCDFAASFGEDFENTIHLFVDGKDKNDDDCEDVGKTTEDRAFANLLGKVDKPEKIGRPYNYKYAVYEPTAYVYDLTQENAQVLLQYASPTDAKTTDAFSYGVSGRTSSDTAGVYVYDGRGSVSETVAKSKVTSTLRYDPYGEITTGAPVQDTIYAYNGEQYTPQTGLIYLRARNYDPTTGTFTSKDTYLGDKLEPVTRNRYTYANNNPISYQDPSGHKGVASRIVSAVKSGARAVAKTVSKAVHSVAKAVTSAPKAVARAVQSGVTAAKKAVQNVATAARAGAQKVVQAASRVVNTAKATVVTATRAIVNRATGAVSTAVRNLGNAVTGTSLAGGTATTYYTDSAQCVVESNPSRKHYDQSKTKSVRVGAKKKAAEHKEEKKQSFFDKIKGKASNAAQKAGEWWNDTKKVVAKKTSQIVSNTKSVIKTVHNKAKQGLQSATKFYEKHKQAIKNIGIGFAVIAGATLLTVATGGAAAAAIPMLLTAVGVGAAGAGIGAVHHRVTTGSWKGAGGAAFDGFGMGFRVGADVAAAYTGIKAAGRVYKAYKAYRAVKTAEASAAVAEATYLAAEEAPELENAATETAEVVSEAATEVSQNLGGASANVSEFLDRYSEVSGSTRERLMSLAQNSKLSSIVNELYRPGASVGDGGTADKLLSEYMAGGAQHLAKAQDRILQLQRLISSSELGFNDLDMAQALRDDLEYAVQFFK